MSTKASLVPLLCAHQMQTHIISCSSLENEADNGMLL